MAGPLNLSAGGAKLLAYWGTIQAGVAARLNTHDLYSAVYSAAADEGYDLGGATALDMGALRSLAVGQRNAAEALSRATPETTLDASMIGTDLSARDLNTQQADPQWMIRFEHNVIENGAPETRWQTSVFSGELPQTKQELLDALDEQGDLYAEDYNAEHVSIGDIAIAAV